MFERELTKQIEFWKKGVRKPLIVRGLRQVGKTTTILDFCKTTTVSSLISISGPIHRFRRFSKGISIGEVGKLTKVNTPSRIWLKPVLEDPVPTQSPIVSPVTSE